MSGWGIAETAPVIEKIKAESADYLRGLNDCGEMTWSVYDKAFDFYMELISRAYEQGKKDAQPMRKKGKWVERESGTEDKENGFETVIVCSYCDFSATTFYSEDCESRTQIRTNYCPNCGAKMGGEDYEIS